MTSGKQALIIRGRQIGEDAFGNLNLTDIWRVAGSPGTKTVPHWRQLSTTDEYIIAVAQNLGKSYVKAKNDYNSVVYSKGGKGGGTFGHIFIAIAYGEYLSAELAVDVKSVYARYRSGDVSLVDEILQKAEAARKFQDTRDVSKQVRNKYTATLTAHGAGGSAIGYCTDAIYQILLGGTCRQITTKRNLPAKANLRDTLPLGELLQTMTTEYMASERIEDMEVHGKEPCAEASRASARFVKEAFERERADRKAQDK
jgi:hypothetical protein